MTGGAAWLRDKKLVIKKTKLHYMKLITYAHRFCGPCSSIKEWWGVGRPLPSFKISSTIRSREQNMLHSPYLKSRKLTG